MLNMLNMHILYFKKMNYARLYRQDLKYKGLQLLPLKIQELENKKLKKIEFI